MDGKKMMNDILNAVGSWMVARPRNLVISLLVAVVLEFFLNWGR